MNSYYVMSPLLSLTHGLICTCYTRTMQDIRAQDLNVAFPAGKDIIERIKALSDPSNDNPKVRGVMQLFPKPLLKLFGRGTEVKVVMEQLGEGHSTRVVIIKGVSPRHRHRHRHLITGLLLTGKHTFVPHKYLPSS